MLNIRKRVLAGSLAGLMICGVAGCKQKNNVSSQNNSLETTTNKSIEVSIDSVKNDLKSLFPQINDDILNNAALMLSLELFAERDENGKLSADKIAEFKKSGIDVNNMMNDFNSFLDMLQQSMIKNFAVYNVSTTLSDNQLNDKKILSSIELILNNIISYSMNNNKEKLLEEFNKIYTLFVDGKELTSNGITFKVSDLSLTSRAVANAYAETAAYYSKEFISEDQYSKIDAALDDQNNKGQTREILAILANETPNESEIKNLSEEFGKLYKNASDIINIKIKTSNQTIKDLVNYLNMDYLNSDKVSVKDKNQIFNGYSDDRLQSVVELIQAITEYNFRNPKNIIALSDFLLPQYLETKTGKNDLIALNYVQFNSYEANETKSTIRDLNSFRNNPYSNNLFTYFTKQDFDHSSKDSNGNVKTDHVNFQEISDGSNFVNNVVIWTTLNKMNFKDKNNYIDKVQINLIEGSKQIQLITTGECKSDTMVFVGQIGRQYYIMR